MGRTEGAHPVKSAPLNSPVHPETTPKAVWLTPTHCTSYVPYGNGRMKSSEGQVFVARPMEARYYLQIFMHGCRFPLPSPTFLPPSMTEFSETQLVPLAFDLSLCWREGVCICCRVYTSIVRPLCIEHILYTLCTVRYHVLLLFLLYTPCS